MMIRSATGSDTGLKALLLALALLLPVVAGAAEDGGEIRVPIAAAPGIAERALREGQPELALQLARGLLQRDPDDAYAHFIIARALMQMKHPREARRAAALAYRHAANGDEKFQAAQLAAKLSLDNEQAGLAQVWLRRSLLHLPHESYRERVIKDYKILRQISPWSISAQFTLSPSNNLNNGADGPYVIVDGVPGIGWLSGDAQAMSGLRAVADLRYARRLSGSKTHETSLTARYYGQRVRLSDAAQTLAPTAENGDYSFDLAEFGLRHVTRAGRGTISYDAGIGRSWYGGAPYQWLVRAGVARGFRLSADAGLNLSAQIQHRSPDSPLQSPVDKLDLRAQYSHKLQSGDRLSIGLTLEAAQSDTANARQRGATGYLGYHLAQPAGPVKISASIGGSLQRYRDYIVGLWPVPGGREDKTVFGAVDFSFYRLDYAGFVPTLRVQARKTQSNVSRFETNEMSVSFGIESSF